MTDRERQRVHFVAGASGTGTSTRALALQRAWSDDASLTRSTVVLCTDVLRAQLRTAIDARTCPELFGESFNLEPGDADDLVVDGVAIGAFQRQCAPILRAVEAGVDYALGEGWHVIVEGVHLVPGSFVVPASTEADVSMELLVVTDPEEHVARFRSRDAASDGRRSARHYERNLERVRVVQQWLVDQLAAWRADAASAEVRVDS